MTPSKEFDPLATLTALHRREVEFVVVGGIAGYIFGSTLPSTNLDICFASDLVNRQHLAAALTDMHAQSRDGSIEVNDKALEPDEILTFKTDYGILHCVRTPPGTNGYDDLRIHAEQVEIDGASTNVATLDDLVRMKEVSSRPKDRYLLETLRATQKLRAKR